MAIRDRGPHVMDDPVNSSTAPAAGQASPGPAAHTVVRRGEDMERNRRDRTGGVLDTVAELFDLPADLVAGLPHLEMVGSRQLYVEHHTGLLSYSGEQIDVNTTGGVLRVRGKDLSLLDMTAEELRIGGTIAAVEWVR